MEIFVYVKLERAYLSGVKLNLYGSGSATTDWLTFLKIRN